MRTLKLDRDTVGEVPSLISLPEPLPRDYLCGDFQSAETLNALLRHKDIVLREMHHRVGNSLQIIASILAMDARKVQSREAQLHLMNASRRIMAVATVQQQLQTSSADGAFEIGAYLRQLCANLTASVAGASPIIAIDVRADTATVSSAAATNVGLIVAELVINALKHAFLSSDAAGRILVTYRVEGACWTLTVSDNGIGGAIGAGKTPPGLGTGIVAAIVRQLDARLAIAPRRPGSGTSISVTGRNPAITGPIH